MTGQSAAWPGVEWAGSVDHRAAADEDGVALFTRVAQCGLARRSDRDVWEISLLLLAVYRSDQPELIRVADAVLARAISRQNSRGHLNLNDPLFFAKPFLSSTLPGALGYAVMERHRRSAHDELLDAGRRQAQALLRAPRSETGMLVSRDVDREFHLDFVFMISPLLAAVGVATGDEGLVDEAYAQANLYLDHLVDRRTGLGRRAWRDRPDEFPRSSFWSRGNGWAAIGILELLASAPSHRAVDGLQERLGDLLCAVARWQDESGLWHDTLDDPRSILETAGSAMHAYALARAVRMGLLPRSFDEQVERALRALLLEIDPEGGLRGVTVPGSTGQPVTGVTVFGQGALALLVQHANTT